MKIAILASGNGSNAQAIIDKTKSGLLDVDVLAIIANRPEAKVLDRAKIAGLPAFLRQPGQYANRLEYDQALVDLLQKLGCEYVVLAGYMLLLSPLFLAAFPYRVLNIHPAILPSFPGVDGIGGALAYGVKITGASVHFVEEAMDAGPLIIQAAVPCKPEDDVEELGNRIHRLEHRIYPQALQWLAEGRLSLEGRHVRLAQGDRPALRPDGEWLVWPPLEQGF